MIRVKNIFTVVLLAAVATAAAFTYPPYEYYTGTTSGTPALNYTKVCEPGRSGEAKATYVVLGHCYPSRPALSNTGYEGEVVIPATIGGLPVRKINDAAFIVCQNITSVQIPATVREIGARAFSDCWRLESITFAEGAGLMTVGDSAFTNCISLTTIKFPKKLSRCERCIQRGNHHERRYACRLLDARAVRNRGGQAYLHDPRSAVTPHG